MNRLRMLLRTLGLPGVIGIGILLACAPFYFGTALPAQRELAAQRSASESLRQRGALRPVALEDRDTQLDRFYDLFPPVDRLGTELERIYGLARESGLDLLQGDYRVEKRSAGLVAYRVNLPVRGSYAQVRGFASAILTDLPIASIDALRFERKKPADAQLDAQLRLTLHFRPASDRPGEHAREQQ